MDIVRKTMSQQVYEVMKKDILCQRLQFGEKLTNASLQERYGVGSMPVRDAINRLHQDGLVGEITKSGTHVITVDLPVALEINEIARMLCCTAVRLSAVRAGRAEVCKHLEAALAAQKKNTANDRYFDYDYDFHCTFFDFAGNSQFKKVYRQYSALLEMLSRAALKCGIANRRDAIKIHADILAAYRDGRVEDAAAKLEEHYNRGDDQLRAFFARKCD